MSDTRQPISSRRPRSRVALALAATFGLVLALAQGLAGPASADPPPPPPPIPTSITVAAFTDPAFIAAHLPGAPADAIPPVLAAKGDSFNVTVSLWDGAVSAAFTDPQVVTLAASGPGELTPMSGNLPAGATSATFAVSYSDAATGVEITATVEGLEGVSNAFDINKFLTFVDGDAASLKDGSAGADGEGCAVINKQNPVCGVVILPDGASSDVALSLGTCPSGESCQSGGFVTQMIANLDGLYTRTNPARMELFCDKSMCGKQGVPQVTALWSTTAFGTLEPVPACSKKGVIDSDLDFCTDYRASHRENAGDVHLVVLFLDDVRGSI